MNIIKILAQGQKTPVPFVLPSSFLLLKAKLDLQTAVIAGIWVSYVGLCKHATCVGYAQIWENLDRAGFGKG
jgi:hypothetical protein